MTFYYTCVKSFAVKKKSANGNSAHGHKRILADSSRKRNRKEVLANCNKTRINIGHQHDHWMELKEALRIQTHTEVQKSVPQCSSEIGTCIINDAGR